MATKNAALRDLLGDAFGDVFDSGDLEIGTTGMAASLCTFTLAADSFGASSSGVVTLLSVPLSDTADADGTAAEAILSSSGDTYQITGLTVGTSGTDIIIDNTSILTGQTVNLTAFTWTESASTA